MKFKLIMAMVEDSLTEVVLEAARAGGATGVTVVTSVRGEGLRPEKTFLGLDLRGARDILLFLVAEPRARDILEAIGAVGNLDENQGSGIALQIGIEDAVGLKSQLAALQQEIEDEI